jgi:hydrogenase expression/formation protein HypE
MPDLGKIDRELFEDVIAPNLGANRDDVRIGPQHGVDFGVLSVGETALVVATDPISILPELGFERAGRLALDIVLADVAVSGVAPTHVAVSLSLPPGMTDDQLTRTWRGLATHADDLGVSVVSGHTARYDGVDYSWVGGGTAFGVGEFEEIVRPDGARPGDDIVISTGPGAEVTGLFAELFPAQLGLPAETLERARDRVEDILTVADAASATRAGAISAMHDATEGGVVGGLSEMAAGASVQFHVERDAAPVRPGVEAVCHAVGVDPWLVTSAGTLLITAPPADATAVVSALEANGTPAAVVGTVTETNGGKPGVVLDGERVHPPASDPAWDAMATLRTE